LDCSGVGKYILLLLVQWNYCIKPGTDSAIVSEVYIFLYIQAIHNHANVLLIVEKKRNPTV